MRALKILGVAIGALIVLIALLLLAVRWFVDPNDYKGRIETAVKSSTGRELTLAGPIRLSVFPWIALELGPASLGNPPGFGTEPFAAVEHVAFRVKVLPLLHKELEVGRIEVDGLDLRLHKNAAGQGNWQDFGKTPATPATPAQPGSKPITLPDLAGVVIKNSHVTYQDMNVDHVDFELGHLSAGEPAPVKLHLTLTPGPTAQPIELGGQFNVILNPAKEQYGIKTLELDGTLKTAANATPLQWKFSAPALDVDLAAETLAVPSFAMQLASVHLDGSVQGTRIVAAPAIRGTFKLDPLSPRDLMTKFGMEVPKTRDPKALTKLAAQGSFDYGSNALATSGLDIQLDDSQLRGKAALTHLDTKAMSFNLAIDRIDLDRYRSPEVAAAQPAPPPGTMAKQDDSSTSALKTLQMDGTVTVGSVKVSNLNLSQLLVSLAARDGVIRIAPAKAKLYGGDYSGDITLDVRGAAPSLKIDQSMSNIDMAPLLKDFAQSQRISGHGTVTTNLTAHALSGDALFRTLNGHVAANVDNGAVEGIDLWFEINRALALVQKQTLPSGQSSGRTKFDAFKASADITNGVAATKDLNIASQNLRVTGQGTLNLVTNAIDYQVKATLLKEAPGAAGASGKTLADIPLNITGTTTSPSVRPDLEALAKARVQQELDKHKDELQQKLMDKLKGVFK